MEISGEELNYLSFPDFLVTNMQIDPSARTCAIQIDGAFLDGASGGRQLPPGVLKVSGWESSSSSMYEGKSKKWVSASSDEKLKDLCEVSFSIDVVLRGFSELTGEWTEHKLYNPKVVCYVC